jgi:hypothetical protein
VLLFLEAGTRNYNLGPLLDTTKRATSKQMKTGIKHEQNQNRYLQV